MSKSLLHEYSLCLANGPQAACLGSLLWDALGERGQRVMLWDVPPHRRARIFSATLRNSGVVGLAWEKEMLAGLAWVTPIMPGARCGMIHFCFTRQEQAAPLAHEFLARLEASRRFDSLVAFLPAVYRHARRFAQAAGFVELGILPGACRLVTATGAKLGPAVLMRFVF